MVFLLLMLLLWPSPLRQPSFFYFVVNCFEFALSFDIVFHSWKSVHQFPCVCCNLLVASRVSCPERYLRQKQHPSELDLVSQKNLLEIQCWVCTVCMCVCTVCMCVCAVCVCMCAWSVCTRCVCLTVEKSVHFSFSRILFAQRKWAVSNFRNWQKENLTEEWGNLIKAILIDSFCVHNGCRARWKQRRCGNRTIGRAKIWWLTDLLFSISPSLLI